MVAGVTEVVDGSFIVRHAFRWDQTGATTGTMTDLGGFGLRSAALAVNDSGSVVVGGADKSVVIDMVNTNRTHATLWKTPANTPTDLGLLAGDTASIATDVSDDGTIVVGMSDPNRVSPPNGDIGGVGYSGAARAFRWTADTGMKDLRQLLVDAGVNMTGIRLVSALGISEDGQYIVGAGIFPDTPSGETNGFTVRYCDTPCPDDFPGANDLLIDFGSNGLYQR